MPEKNKRKVGNIGEDMAVKYLQEKNYTILERNYYSRYGEIDIIAKDQKTLVFIEVKYRKNNSFGSPLESISSKKIKCICKTAKKYIVSEDIDARFDVISINGTEIEHLTNAFDYQY